MGMDASATKLAVLVLPIAVFATAISVATAQTAAPGNVVQRQDGMKAMANAAKSINAMFKDTSQACIWHFVLHVSHIITDGPESVPYSTPMPLKEQQPLQYRSQIRIRKNR